MYKHFSISLMLTVATVTLTMNNSMYLPQTLVNVMYKIDAADFITRIENNQDLLHRKDKENSDTLLHLAVLNKYHSLEIIQFLYEDYNCNINCVNNEGDTPLHYAVNVRNTEIIAYLLSIDYCNKHAINTYGYKPIKNYTTNEIQSLFKMAAFPPVNSADERFKKSLSTSLIYACYANKTEYALDILEYPDLLESNFTLSNFGNIYYGANTTALHYACRQGNPAVIEKLLTLTDINVNAQDSRSETPLFKAIRFFVNDDYREFITTISLLLSHPNINPNIKNFNGYTPLEQAGQYRNENILSKELYEKIMHTFEQRNFA